VSHSLAACHLQPPGALIPVRPNSYLGAVYLLTSAVQFFLWLSFAVHYPLSVVVSDACGQVDRYLANPSDDNPLVSCVSRGTFLPSFDYVTTDLQNTLTEISTLITPYVNISDRLPVVEPTLEQTVASLSEWTGRELDRVNQGLDLLPDSRVVRSITLFVRLCFTYALSVSAAARSIGVWRWRWRWWCVVA
jgi:hypothetical protein